MFQLFPYYIKQGEFSLFTTSIDSEISSIDQEVLNNIFTSFQLINVLRGMHNPLKNTFLDNSIAVSVKSLIADNLLKASDKARDIRLKETLFDRAQSFSSDKYEKISLVYSKKLDLPLELVIGFMPSWRYKKKPKTFSGLLAVPDHMDTDFLDGVDLYIPEII